jgi:hypothetical protein
VNPRTELTDESSRVVAPADQDTDEWYNHGYPDYHYNPYGYNVNYYRGHHWRGRRSAATFEDDQKADESSNYYPGFGSYYYRPYSSYYYNRYHHYPSSSYYSYRYYH